ncbi:MAG: hypothetical protein B7X09_02170 [Acidiphilium sp. 21-66-27]|nr:MAG: hypothetical protein B7X09_02170 [Acidiphilium sp. 21-66-27]
MLWSYLAVVELRRRDAGVSKLNADHGRQDTYWISMIHIFPDRQRDGIMQNDPGYSTARSDPSDRMML